MKMAREALLLVVTVFTIWSEKFQTDEPWKEKFGNWWWILVPTYLLRFHWILCNSDQTVTNIKMPFWSPSFVRLWSELYAFAWWLKWLYMAPIFQRISLSFSSKLLSKILCYNQWLQLLVQTKIQAVLCLRWRELAFRVTVHTGAEANLTNEPKPIQGPWRQLDLTQIKQTSFGSSPFYKTDHTKSPWLSIFSSVKLFPNSWCRNVDR